MPHAGVTRLDSAVVLLACSLDGVLHDWQGGECQVEARDACQSPDVLGSAAETKIYAANDRITYGDERNSSRSAIRHATSPCEIVVAPDLSEPSLFQTIENSAQPEAEPSVAVAVSQVGTQSRDIGVDTS